MEVTVQDYPGTLADTVFTNASEGPITFPGYEKDMVVLILNDHVDTDRTVTFSANGVDIDQESDGGEILASDMPKLCPFGEYTAIRPSKDVYANDGLLSATIGGPFADIHIALVRVTQNGSWWWTNPKHVQNQT